MKDKLIPKIEKLNMRYFHSVYSISVEVHHCIPKGMGGAVKITNCCLHFFVPAPHGHQNDHVFVETIRERFQPDIGRAKGNYVEEIGCKEEIFKECNFCKMPRIGKDGGEIPEEEIK